MYNLNVSCPDLCQGHSNNFGHPAIRELIHIFLFSRENRIGNLRPAEFGRRIPNNTLMLAVTAVLLFYYHTTFELH